jgi:hypothetical protein
MEEDWSSSQVLQWYNTMGRLEHKTRTQRHTQDIQMPCISYTKNLRKRRLRRGWHWLRTPKSKRLLNTATQELKQFLNKNKNDCIQTFLQHLTPTESTVEGNQENKTGQQTFSTTWDITRNLGKKQRPKSTCFCWTLSKRFSTASLRKWTWIWRNTYTTSRDPLPTRTTNQPSQKSWSSRSHQQPKY